MEREECVGQGHLAREMAYSRFNGNAGGNLGQGRH